MRSQVPFHDRRLLGPFQYWNSAAVLGLLAVHAALLACSATRHSPTLNEPGHLVAGLMQWEFGRFDVYKVNPPLTHYVAAFPVMIAGYEPAWSGLSETPGARPEFTMGEEFIAANGERSIWLFTLARWSCIPISLAGGLFCFLWSRELWNGNLAGLVSLTLWCFDPNILAHGEMITSDCAAAALGLGAGYSFWRWLKRPGWSRALGAGLCLGLALLSKTTWIILFVLWPLLWLTLRTRSAARHQTSPGGATAPLSTLSGEPSPCVDQPSTRNHQPFLQLAAILALALYVLNAGYMFDGTFTRIKDLTFISTAFSGAERPRTPGNRFTGSILAHAPLPFPKQYVLGLDLQKADFENYGHSSYLRGEWRDRGWWYYYLYGLAVKMPHGTQFLLALAFIIMFRDFGHPKQESRAAAVPLGAMPSARRRDLVVLLSPALLVLALVSSQLEFNHHVRYVLPVLGFLFVFIGCVADQRSRAVP